MINTKHGKKDILIILSCMVILSACLIFIISCNNEDAGNKPLFVAYFSAKETGKGPADEVMEGILVLDVRYLRVESLDSNESYLVIWPYGYHLFTGNGKVNILDENGRTVASEGDIIKFSGGMVSAETAIKSASIQGVDKIKGPYWLMDDMIYRHPSPYDPEHREYLQLGEAYGEDPYLFDSVSYAERYNITPEIAIERFEILQTLIGLDTYLKNNESEIYGRLYIRHSPGFRIVTLFTGNGEETVKSYLPDELFEYIEIQNVSISYSSLVQTRTWITETLNNLEIITESYIDIRENSIVVHVMDLSRIDTAVQENELKIPEYVKIVEVGKFGIPENVPTD